MIVPFLNLLRQNEMLENELKAAMEQVLLSGWYIQGECCKRFEQEFAQYTGAGRCVGVSNGLDALTLSLKALGVGPGDEVILPSNTYIASCLAATHVGATPVFIEPNVDTFNMDTTMLDSLIGSKTKAIMPVHLFGQAVEMDEVVAIADRNGLAVVEDCAQSHGAKWKGKSVGTFGECNAFSFYPGKNLGALGDAGAICLDSGVLAEELRVLRNYGSDRKYYNAKIGHNMRLDELQAAVLSVKLTCLDQWTELRIDLANRYALELDGVGDIVCPVIADGATHVYHLYVIKTMKRDALMEFLKLKGIGCLIHYPVPPHLQQAYSFLGYKRGDYPVAERLSSSMLSLPLWPLMRSDEQSYIIKQVKLFFES